MGYRPRDPVRTGMFVTIKRLFDPSAVLCGISGLMLYICP